MKATNISSPVSDGNSRNSVLPIRKLSWIEIVAILLSIWFVVYPKPYKILLAVLLAIPLLGLVLNSFSKSGMASLVSIVPGRRGRKRYDVADFLDIAAWAVLIRVILDYEFESLRSLIIPGSIAFVLVLVLLFSTHRLIDKSVRNKGWIYGLILFNICLYSYAGTYAANCAFDNSNPTIYRTEVLDKRVSKGRRSTRYYITIAPWGHHFDKEEISVRAVQFNELNIGDSVNIDLKKGVFGIPWYYVEGKNYNAQE